MLTKFHGKRIISIVGIVTLCLSLEWSCKPKDQGIATPDQPPVVHLANIPVDDPAVVPDTARFTKSPLVKLYWVGNDADGFVVAFMYRWSFKDSNASTTVKYQPWTTVLNYVLTLGVTDPVNGRTLMLDVDPALAPSIAPKVLKYFANIALDPDKLSSSSAVYDTSLVHYLQRIDNGETVSVPGVEGAKVHASNPKGVSFPVHMSPNIGSFIFESNDFYNRHKFEIKAIDNEGIVGNTDSLRFWNRSVLPPQIYIPTPYKRTDTLFILKNTTYTWPGIIFNYQAIDKNSRTLEYSWHVDSHDWSAWSQDVSAPVTATDVDIPYTGLHVFTVRARNEFGAISPPEAQPRDTFFTVFPPFAAGQPKRVLLVHEARGNPIDDPPRPSTATVTNYYTGIFDSLHVPYDVWNAHLSGQPKAIDLANYSTVYLFADVLPYIGPDVTKMKIRSLIYGKYLDVGGTMIMNGVPWPIFLQVFAEAPESLLVRHLSLNDISDTYLLNRKPDFIRAIGNTRLGYPDVTLDSVKLDPAAGGGLPLVAVCRPQGFGEIIYRFDSKSDSVQFENQPLGLRYLGITYKTVYFGFPLYFCKRDQATAAIRRALQDVGQF